MFYFFFFFNDTATTEIYTLSLHDALPISVCDRQRAGARQGRAARGAQAPHRRTRLARQARRLHQPGAEALRDRKSTRLNSSHSQISYAVFCLKKKKKTQQITHLQTAVRMYTACS